MYFNVEPQGLPIQIASDGPAQAYASQETVPTRRKTWP